MSVNKNLNSNSITNSKLRKFGMYVALAVLATLPGLILRLSGTKINPLVDTLIAGAAILGAGFMLSWGAESAEEHVSQGLALAGLALVTVLPEYAVDIYYTYQAGLHPNSEYVGFAAANMTGSNRLLIGTAWPLVVILFWWRSGRRAVQLHWENSAEIVFLALASLYSFVITLKSRIDLFDFIILIGLFVAYLWRVSKTPRKIHAEDNDSGVENKGDEDNDGNNDDEEVEVGPAALLAELPVMQQWAINDNLYQNRGCEPGWSNRLRLAAWPGLNSAITFLFLGNTYFIRPHLHPTSFPFLYEETRSGIASPPFES